MRCALESALALAEAGRLPWSTDALQRFFDRREAEGYPAEHHSRPYWSAYRPAYRVIAGDLADALLEGAR